MTTVDALLDEVKNTPDAIVAETLDFLRFLKHQHARQIDDDELTEQDKRDYMQQSLQYAAQLYGDEDDLLPVEKSGDETHVAAR